ncbi:FBD-associated F-box protein, partial [Clarias magur]
REKHVRLFASVEMCVRAKREVNRESFPHSFASNSLLSRSFRVFSAHPRCSHGDVLAGLWTCSNSLNLPIGASFLSFEMVHLLCIQYETAPG